MAHRLYTDTTMSDSMRYLTRDILECTACPRLSQYIREVAIKKTKRFANYNYHGHPVPGFGDINARLLLVGLAPAAHGANRTGRMFTGDSSGDWLARVMHKYGFASRPTSYSAGDGLMLHDAYVTAAARCAPPGNHPTAEELNNCSIYLKREMMLLKHVQVILCMGGIAYKAVCRLLQIRPGKFGHFNKHTHQGIDILTSYHPSRQNTQTGRLTWEEWDKVFAHAHEILV